MEIPHDAAEKLIFDLVFIPGPSGREAEASNLLALRLPGLGWDSAEIDEAGNVVATKGNGPTEFLLLGHIDTVPGGPEVRIEGNTLWGRGSVDARGPLCAFAVAGGAVELPPEWRLTLVAAVREETDSLGARHRIPLHTPAACLVGEPSGTDGITLAYRGYLQVRLTAGDTGAHRSGGTSPLTACLRVAADILGEIEGQDAPARPAVERTGANVLCMSGSEEGNRTASIDLDIRLPLGAVPDTVFDFCRAKAEARCVSATLVSSVAAHSAGRDNPVVRALRVAIRENGGTPRLLAKSGTADFNYAAAWNCPMAAWGPGDSRLDHTADERLNLEEYARSVRVLSGMFRVFFGNPDSRVRL